MAKGINEMEKGMKMDKGYVRKGMVNEKVKLNSKMDWKKKKNNQKMIYTITFSIILSKRMVMEKWMARNR